MYQLIFPAHRVFRYAGMGWTLVEIIYEVEVTLGGESHSGTDKDVMRFEK